MRANQVLRRVIAAFYCRCSRVALNWRWGEGGRGKLMLE